MALTKLVCFYLTLTCAIQNFAALPVDLTLEECKEIAWDCNLACHEQSCPGNIVWALDEVGICNVVLNDCFFNSRVCNALLKAEKPLKKVTEEECVSRCPNCLNDTVTQKYLCGSNGHLYDLFSTECNMMKLSCEIGEYWYETDMKSCHAHLKHELEKSRTLQL